MHYFCMSKWFIALLFLATPVLAQERPTAYQALRTVGTQLNRDFVNHVISVTGTNGDPQPETWNILLDDPRRAGGVREVEVSNGRIISERTPLRSAVEGSLGAAIDTAKLNLDSSGAFTLAQQTAEKSHVTFADRRLHPAGRRTGQPDLDGRVCSDKMASRPGPFTSAPITARSRAPKGLFSGGDQTAVVDEQSDEPIRRGRG